MPSSAIANSRFMVFARLTLATFEEKVRQMSAWALTKNPPIY